MNIKPYLFFILLATLLVIPVSADNVTITIFEAAGEEFFIEYNDGYFPCVNGTCTFDIVDINGTEYEMSKDDMEKIAEYVALEIDTSSNTFGGSNETFILTALDQTEEDITDNLRAYTLNTLVPELERFEALAQQVIQLEKDLAESASESKNYDAMVETKDTTISTLERELNRSDFISMLCFIGMLFVLLTCTHGGKAILESVGKTIRRER